MIERKVNGSQLELVQGDITRQEDCEAVVNAANAELLPGGGVAGAIHRAAGPELLEECRPLAPITPGEAVLTRGYNLPNSYIIHCLGPIYGHDHPEEELLARCYVNAIRLAQENEINSIAFPAISTGAFGYPSKDAAKIAIKTVLEELPKNPGLKLIRFVLFGEKDFEIHKNELRGI